MGCFNFQCAECGPGEDGERDYFDKPAAVAVRLSDGKVVIVHGRYTGYGEVETETGHTFYHPQFEEFWAGWLNYAPNNHGEKGPFIAEEIYCEECLYDRDPTPLHHYDFSQMTKVVDYLAAEEKREAAAAHAAAAPAAPAAGGGGGSASLMGAAAAPSKAKKAPKPKALTKDQLAAKVAELEAEVARLKPLAERATRLGEMYTEMQAKYTRLRGCMDKIKEAFREDVGYW